MTKDVVPDLISVLVPVYNSETYLAETLRSVLDQEGAPFELLVIDDGSSDRSRVIAASFGEAVRVIVCPHRGLAATRNSGIAAARGEFLLHLDADDLLVPGSLSLRMQHFAVDPRLDIVVGRLMCFLSPDMAAEDRHRYMVPPEPQQGHLPGAALIRASAFTRFGLLNERFEVNADLEWTVRARDEGARICSIGDVVVHRRIHGRNMSIALKHELDITRMSILRASLARRRTVGAGLDGEANR